MTCKTQCACRQCLAGSLSPEKVKGKIVLCWRGTGMRVAKGMEVKRAGGVGFILGNSKANGVEIACDPHVLPATAVTYSNANKIAEYINSTKNPNATIIPAKTVLHTKPAPFMTAFTSRGPSTIDPDILKVNACFHSFFLVMLPDYQFGTHMHENVGEY